MFNAQLKRFLSISITPTNDLEESLTFLIVSKFMELDESQIAFRLRLYSTLKTGLPSAIKVST